MDPITAQFLQESLRNYTPVVPTLTNPYSYLTEGFNTGTQLQTAAAAGQRLQAANQSLAAAQQQYAITAQTSPYNLALLQEKVATLPMDRKYNQDIQAATARRLGAQADEQEARAASFGPSAAGSTFQWTPPPPIPDDSAAPTAVAPATDATGAPAPTDDFTRGNQGWDPSGGGNLLTAPALPQSTSPLAPPPPTNSPLLGSNDTPVPTFIDPTASPSDMLASNPDVDTSNLAAISGAYIPGDLQYKAPAQTADDDPLPEPDNADGTANIAGSVPADSAAIPGYDGSQTSWISNDNPSGPLDMTGGASPGPAAGGAGAVRVPVSEADLISQRNSFETAAATARAASLKPSDRRLLEAQISGRERALNAVEKQFRDTQTAKQRQAEASAKTAKINATVASNDKPTDPPQPGYTWTATRYTNGKMQWRQLPDVQTQAKQAKGVSDYLNSMYGHPLADFQSAGPEDTHLMPNGDVAYDMGGGDGAVKDRVIMAKRDYDNMRGVIDTIRGAAPDAPAQTSSPSQAAINNLSSDPEFMRPLPGGGSPVTPMRFTMAGMQPATAQNAPPPASTPAATPLAATASTIAPQTPQEAEAERVLTQQKQKQAQDAADAASGTPRFTGSDVFGTNSVLGNSYPGAILDWLGSRAATPAQTAANTANTKTLAYKMSNQVSSYENQIDQLNATLDRQLHPAPKSPRAMDSDIAYTAQQIKEYRARLMAAKDRSNYKVGPDGSYIYNDPLGNVLPNGLQSTAAGASTSFAPAR